MKNLFLIILITLFYSCKTVSQESKETKKKYTVELTKEAWKEKLTPMQFYILRESGTERPHTSKLNKVYDKGIFVCAGCETALYKSEHKFDSHSGWPSFDRAIEENVALDVDYKIGYARTELKCNTCGGHLGHSFNDGPKTTGKRHCINGGALKFIPEEN